MGWFSRIKPKFWFYKDEAAGPYRYLFDFPRIWKLAVFLTSGVVLIPLVFLAVIDYKVTQRAAESEIFFRTSRLVSNTQRTVSFFITERRSALEYVLRNNSFEELNDPQRLEEILVNLKASFGGFTDLGMIDPQGIQRTYAGPFNLKGRDYSDQDWYKQVLEKEVYISEVFMGLRQVPHMVIALKKMHPNGSPYVLRASLDTEKFNYLLSGLEMTGMGDAFLIDHQGALQTPSRSFGPVLDKIAVPIPEYASETRVVDTKTPGGVPIIIGYRYIEGTPFILMVVKQKTEALKSWYNARMQLVGILISSVVIVFLVVLGISTYLVGKMFIADQRRVIACREVEHADKMASIGRLAAGVAHEINNPLSIINEKAGLIKDLFTLKREYAADPKLNELVDSVLLSVERCGKITKRLLNFARRMDTSVRQIELEKLVQEVLGFLRKEADYRSISITVDISNDIPPLVTDLGKFQQILLNLFNNAFEAMQDGGHLDIRAVPENESNVRITIRDDGCGIPKENLNRIFEPFFTTKTGSGGTGLGLSITYGLVQEIEGHIQVESTVGKGTTFTIFLPVRLGKELPVLIPYGTDERS